MREVRTPLGISASLIALAFIGSVVAGASLLAALAGATVAMALAGGAQLRRVGALPVPVAGAHRRRRRKGFVGRTLGFVSLNVGRRLLQRAVQPQYLFLSYAESDREKRAYIPVWVEKLVRRPVFPSGLIRFGRFWGLMVSGMITAESFEHSPEKLQRLLDNAREAYPNIEVIALAGRLPSMAARSGVSLDDPFITGDRGTLCAMLGAAREQARLLDRPPADLTIAIAGGGGFIGRQLVEELRREFRAVVSIDPRFNNARHWEDNVLFTDCHEDVALAQAVFALTARGDDCADFVPFLAAGTIVADDTHPEIPPTIREGMERRGATVFKATVGDSRFRLLPRAPWFRGDDIPGCLLEALVIVQAGKRVLASQAAFNAAAEELGFRSRLAPHTFGSRKR